MNALEEGCDHNDPDDVCIYLMCECGHVRSHDSEDNIPLQSRMNRELQYKLIKLNNLIKLLIEVAQNNKQCVVSKFSSVIIKSNHLYCVWCTDILNIEMQYNSLFPFNRM
jgi:hypothetical protein